MKPPKMVIISSYLDQESYGLLGPQMAATIIREHAGINCIVVAVTREDNKSRLKQCLSDFFGKDRPVVAFSTLSGRPDLFEFAAELTSEGVFTILAGPQARDDFMGETGWQEHPHRFNGFSQKFSMALQGPAQQILPVLEDLNAPGIWQHLPGVVTFQKNEKFINNPPLPWDAGYLNRVNWDNLYRLNGDTFTPFKISTAQVLQQIGCPHAKTARTIDIAYPAQLDPNGDKCIQIKVSGCSFCDVARDKSFFGNLDMDTVLSQIKALPEDSAGRTLPFELINENPIPVLKKLMTDCRASSIKLSQIQLTMRSDWFVRGEEKLRKALETAKKLSIHIMASSMGFEAFDDRLLSMFNKGTRFADHLKAVRLMRQLKNDFPETWSYSSREGAVHGFIHPTPWDTSSTAGTTGKNIMIYGLSQDILPPASTPLIIHHASSLGEWIRQIEAREKVYYKRYGSIIAWWDDPKRTHRLLF